MALARDGAGGGGEGTVARSGAKRLGFIDADAGAVYRAVGLYMLEHGGAKDVHRAFEDTAMKAYRARVEEFRDEKRGYQY